MSEQTMADFENELNASFKKFQEGDIVTGTVIGVSDTQITLDLKSYAEGIIAVSDYSADPDFSINDIEIGEEISATVISEDDGNGNIVLSKKEANNVVAWDKLEQLKNDETVLTVKIGGVVNGGVIAYVEGIRGFIPASKLALTYVEDLNEWLNKEVKVQIITADKKENRLVLSAKELLQKEASEKQSHMISNIEVGLVTEGVVESLQPYGAFVQLSNGLTGLVHISQICNKRIKHPSVVLKEGQHVTVKVIAIKDGKLSLSMKALEEVAAEEIHEEEIELPESEEIATNLGALLKGIKL